MNIGTARELLTAKKTRKKTIKQELGCKFIRIDPDKEDFDVFKAINEILRHIKQSTKKLLELLELEFKSYSSKAMKYIIKKLLPNYK